MVRNLRLGLCVDVFSPMREPCCCCCSYCRCRCCRCVAVAKLLLQEVLLVTVTSGSLRTAVYFQSTIGGGCWFATAEEY